MTTPLRQLGAINASIENAKGANDFAKLAQFIMRSGGVSKAAFAIETQGTKVGNLGPRLAGILAGGDGYKISRESLRQKAAVTFSGLSGSPFADYSAIANGFVSSLVNAAAFDTMLAGGMVPVPLGTGTVGAVSVNATAYSVGEGSAKQISKLTLTGQQQNPQKAHCAVVLTQELVKAAGANATAFIARSLRDALAVQTDTAFLATLTSGLSAITSTGSTGEAIRADIGNLLRAISTGQTSRLFLVTTPLICKTWSMATDQKGVSAFPSLSPTGGSINGITVLPSDAVTAGNVILADASGIAGASGDVELSEIQEGTLFADSAPDSPPSASTVAVSLWQENLAAIVVERFFVGVRLRSDAVALCNNTASYGSTNSPP